MWRRETGFQKLIGQSSLAGPIREVIADVVTRTRLWRKEKLDVARELIAHFDDAIGNGVGADVAIREFGDAKQAARLIRRAKKRQRSLYWQTCHRISQSLVVLILFCIVAYGFLIARYFAGRPVVNTDYTAIINAPVLALPEDQCAWPLYREAFLKLDRPFPAELQAVYLIPPTDADWTELTPVLHRIEPSLEIIREAAPRRYVGAPLTQTIDLELHEQFRVLSIESPWTFDAPLPEHPRLMDNSGVRRVLRTIRAMLVADARLAVIEGDAIRTVTNLQAMIGLADQFRRGPLIIDDVLSVNTLNSVSKQLQEVLGIKRHLLSKDQLRALAHRLSAYSGGGAFHIRFDSERARFADEIQRMYTDDGHGDGRITGSGMTLLEGVGPEIPFFGQSKPGERLDWLKEPAAALLIAGRREVVRDFEKQLAIIEAQSARPMWLWDEVPGNSFESRVADDEYRNRYPPLLALLPALGRASQTAEIATQRRDAALTVIALE